MYGFDDNKHKCNICLSVLPNRFHPTQEQVENRALISVDARTSEQVWDQLSKVFYSSKLIFFKTSG